MEYPRPTNCPKCTFIVLGKNCPTCGIHPETWLLAREEEYQRRDREFFEIEEDYIQSGTSGTAEKVEEIKPEVKENKHLCEFCKQKGATKENRECTEHKNLRRKVNKVRKSKKISRGDGSFKSLAKLSTNNPESIIQVKPPQNLNKRLTSNIGKPWKYPQKVTGLKAENWVKIIDKWIPLMEQNNFYEQYYTPENIVKDVLIEGDKIFDFKNYRLKYKDIDLVDPTAGDCRFNIYFKHLFNDPEMINIDIDPRIKSVKGVNQSLTLCMDILNIDFKGIKQNYITNPPFGSNKFSRPMARKIRHKLFNNTSDFCILLTTQKDFEYLSKSKYSDHIFKLKEYEYLMPKLYDHHTMKEKPIQIIAYFYAPKMTKTFPLVPLASGPGIKAFNNKTGRNVTNIIAYHGCHNFNLEYLKLTKSTQLINKGLNIWGNYLYCLAEEMKEQIGFSNETLNYDWYSYPIHLTVFVSKGIEMIENKWILAQEFKIIDVIIHSDDGSISQMWPDLMKNKITKAKFALLYQNYNTNKQTTSFKALNLLFTVPKRLIRGALKQYRADQRELVQHILYGPHNCININDRCTFNNLAGDCNFIVLPNCWMCEYISNNPEQQTKEHQDYFNVKDAKASHYQQQPALVNTNHRLIIYKYHLSSIEAKPLEEESKRYFNQPIISTNPSFPSHYHFHQFYDKNNNEQIILECQKPQIQLLNPSSTIITPPNSSESKEECQILFMHQFKGDEKCPCCERTPPIIYHPYQMESMRSHKKYAIDNAHRPQIFKAMRFTFFKQSQIAMTFNTKSRCQMCRYNEIETFMDPDLIFMDVCYYCYCLLVRATQKFIEYGDGREKYADDPIAAKSFIVKRQFMVTEGKITEYETSEAYKYISTITTKDKDLRERQQKIHDQLGVYKERTFNQLKEMAIEQGLENVALSLKAIGVDVNTSKEAIKISGESDMDPTEQETGLKFIWQQIYSSGSREVNVKNLQNLSLKTFQEYYYNIWGPWGTGKSFQTRRFAQPKDLIVCGTFALKLEYTIKLCELHEIDCPFTKESPPSRKLLSDFLKNHSGQDLPYIKTFQVAAMIPPGTSFDVIWVDECYMNEMIYSLWYTYFNYQSAKNKRSATVMIGDHLQVNAVDFQKVAPDNLGLITFKHFREFLKDNNIYTLLSTWRCGLDAVYYMVKYFGYPSSMTSVNKKFNTYEIHKKYDWMSKRNFTRVTCFIPTTEGNPRPKTLTTNAILGSHAMVMHQNDKNYFHFAQVNTVAEFQGNENFQEDLYLRKNYIHISTGHEVVALTRHIDKLNVVYQDEINTFQFLQNDKPNPNTLLNYYIDKKTIKPWTGFLDLRSPKTEFTIFTSRTIHTTGQRKIEYMKCPTHGKIDDYYFDDDQILCNECDMDCVPWKDDDNDNSDDENTIKCLNRTCANMIPLEEDVCHLCLDIFKFNKSLGEHHESISYQCKSCGGQDFKHKRSCTYFNSSLDSSSSSKQSRCIPASAGTPNCFWGKNRGDRHAPTCGNKDHDECPGNIGCSNRCPNSIVGVPSALPKCIDCKKEKSFTMTSGRCIDCEDKYNEIHKCTHKEQTFSKGKRIFSCKDCYERLECQCTEAPHGLLCRYKDANVYNVYDELYRREDRPQRRPPQDRKSYQSRSSYRR